MQLITFKTSISLFENAIAIIYYEILFSLLKIFKDEVSTLLSVSC